MKWVIVCSNRTGSTMLNAAFENSYKSISAFGEACVAKKATEKFLQAEGRPPFIKWMRKYKYEHSLWYWYKNYRNGCTSDDISDWVDGNIIANWLTWLYSQNEHVCFKLMWNHIVKHPSIVDIIKFMDIKVIYLTRDPLQRAISYKNKFKAKKSHAQLIEDFNKEAEDIETWFPEHCKVTYEALTHNKDVVVLSVEETTKMFSYLGIYEPFPVLWTAFPKEKYGAS